MSGVLQAKTENRLLTSYPLGSFREFSMICSPLILSLFFICLMGTCDRFFLSHYSLQALEACGSASYLAFLFQIPCMKITSVAQVFVGQYRGAEQSGRIGEVVWQMIWFSFLTMFLTLPLGTVTASYFFANTSLQELGLSYFNSLMLANFLFPLGAALAAFFTGQGQTGVISWVMALC
ncbi:MAG: MATE family efflux transporter, partial [Rhabdochlamydiaceae bacterium]